MSKRHSASLLRSAASLPRPTVWGRPVPPRPGVFARLPAESHRSIELTRVGKCIRAGDACGGRRATDLAGPRRRLPVLVAVQTVLYTAHGRFVGRGLGDRPAELGDRRRIRRAWSRPSHADGGGVGTLTTPPRIRDACRRIRVVASATSPPSPIATSSAWATSATAGIASHRSQRRAPRRSARGTTVPCDLRVEVPDGYAEGERRAARARRRATCPGRRGRQRRTVRRRAWVRGIVGRRRRRVARGVDCGRRRAAAGRPRSYPCQRRGSGGSAPEHGDLKRTRTTLRARNVFPEGASTIEARSGGGLVDAPLAVAVGLVSG